ncbi:MAG TPA: phosphotransferase [Gemmatimonadaceae bacterium]|nr:phosphotransferase [Gemmatimonadaceae bacterium]
MEHPALTASGLTDLLRRGGSLTRGEVLDVQVERELQTWVSHLAFVRVQYSAHASRDLPCSLLLKWPATGSGQRGPDDDAERDFYARVGRSLPSPPMVRCLAAVEGAEGRSTLVLEDLRSSHDHRPWPIPPSRPRCEAALDALARVHAEWWEHPSLGKTIGAPHTAESLREMVQGIGAELPAFLADVGDALPRRGRETLERVFSSPLRPWLRLADPHALTLAHGDAHSWNFLFPRGGAGPAYLIDWQTWHVDVGARDVAYLIALHWPPSRRRELEQPLLRHYHEQLLRGGVEGYPFEALLLEYRRCAVRNLTFPIIFWKRGMAPEGWWNRLDHALAAYRDLECEELL